jgi:uncharacterized protein (DUF1330 family)
MKKYRKNYVLWSVASVSAALLLANCTPVKTKTSQERPATMSTPIAYENTLNLKKGQVLSIVAPVTKRGGKKALDEYYSRVFPIAGKLGLKRVVQLDVGDKVVGDFDPEALLFFSWPNAEAEQQLYAHSDWPELKALRPKAWKELRIFSDVLEEDLNLTFDPDKYYTVAVAWINPENPTDYDQYLAGIEGDLHKIGGRFIYKMINPRFEKHASNLPAPGQLTFVEWDTKAGLSKLGSTDAYKNNVHFLSSGVVGFELHRIAFTPPSVKG